MIKGIRFAVYETYEPSPQPPQNIFEKEPSVHLVYKLSA